MTLSSGGANIPAWETALRAIIMRQYAVCSNIIMYQMPGSPEKGKDLCIQYFHHKHLCHKHFCHKHFCYVTNWP